MKYFLANLNAIDWEEITTTIHEKGYALVPRFLSAERCQSLIDQYNRPDGYRKTVMMERYRFGRGEYKY